MSFFGSQRRASRYYRTDAFEINTHWLFAVDVLRGIHCRGEHARVLEWRRRNDDGINAGRGQQLLKILVDGGLLGFDRPRG